MRSQHALVRFVLFMFIGQSFLLSGCATNSYQLMKQSKHELRSQTVIEQIATKLEALEERVSQAQANDVKTYAPYHMDRALDSLASARSNYQEFLSDPSSVNDSVSLFFGESRGESTLSKIAAANAALAQAEENKKQADYILAESNENFKWLNKFGAPVHFRYAYQDVERAHKSLISFIARGDIDRAKSRVVSLLKEQKALEIVSAQHFYLNDVSKRIQNTRSRDLNRYAALSYGSSLSALNRAKVIIAKDTRNEASILKAKKEAEFSYDVANAIAKDMKKLANMDRREMERWLLLLTNKLNDTGMQLGASDLRNHTVLQQLDLIAAIAMDQRSLPVANEAIAEAPIESVEQPVIADAEPETKSQPSDKALVNRVSQLEATLTQQIKALTEQMKTMQAMNQRASIAEPVEVKSDYVPLSERRSLFSY